MIRDITIGQYYAKESDYFEAQSINKKTKAEKYCLNVKNDIEQIILDIDFAAKAGFERGHKLFDEYLSGYNIEALLSGELIIWMLLLEILTIMFIL